MIFNDTQEDYEGDWAGSVSVEIEELENDEPSQEQIDKLGRKIEAAGEVC